MSWGQTLCNSSRLLPQFAIWLILQICRFWAVRIDRFHRKSCSVWWASDYDSSQMISDTVDISADSRTHIVLISHMSPSNEVHVVSLLFSEWLKSQVKINYKKVMCNPQLFRSLVFSNLLPLATTNNNQALCLQHLHRQTPLRLFQKKWTCSYFRLHTPKMKQIHRSF